MDRAVKSSNMTFGEWVCVALYIVLAALTGWWGAQGYAKYIEQKIPPEIEYQPVKQKDDPCLRYALPYSKETVRCPVTI